MGNRKKIAHSKTKQDFDRWNGQKQLSHFEKERPHFREQEVWFCVLGSNIGFEEDGSGEDFLRPVLILKKFNNEIFWALPMTTSFKEGKYYFEVSFGENKKSSLILSQIRLIDAKRLVYKAGFVRMPEFKEIKKRVKSLLE